MNSQLVLRKIVRGLERESPTILTGLGVGGIVTTIILAVRATPKALYLIEQEKERRYNKDKGAEKSLNISKIDIVKLTWKCYVPTVLMGTSTAICFIGAHRINLRRNAALASLYTVSTEALKTYQEKVIEVIGENKERKIREAIIEDELDKNPLSKNEIIITGKGETLFYDSWSGRYFKSDLQKVRKIQNDLNYNFLGGHDMYLSLNDFYHEIGLENIEAGNDVGWSLDYGQLDIEFTSKIADSGDPCIVIKYKFYPKHF